MTAPMIMTHCPTDPNLLAAFIDGRLDGEERRTVAEHMATCAECRDALNLRAEIPEEILEPVMAAEPATTNVVAMRRSWLAPAMTLAAAAAIAAWVFLGPIGERYSMGRKMNALVAAAGQADERPVAGRFSVDMPYKKHPVWRSAGGKESSNYQLDAAALNVVVAAKENPTAANLHAGGIAYLMLDNTTQENNKKRGVKLLEEALLLRTSQQDIGKAIAAATDARLLNDLAVGYYATRDDERARAAIERAWSLEKTPPIAWTRATVLNTTAAWDDYLALDKDSPWAAEAREKRDPYSGN